MSDSTHKLKTPSLPSVARALDILNQVASSHNGLTLSQLTRCLDVPRSTMHCLLLTLEREGYVLRGSAGSSYRCGPKLLDLSGKALAGSNLRAVAMPALRSLMQRTSLTVHLAVPDRDQVVIIAQAAPMAAPATSFLGQRLELHCTALGKAIAANLPKAQLSAILTGRALLPHNEKTVTSHRRFLAELDATRERGYAIDDEEDAIGYRCLGAAILDSCRTPIAAISLFGTILEISAENAAALAAQLRRTAERIAASFEGNCHPAETPDAAAEEAVHSAKSELDRLV
jgi:DNA-binding IclR family transcriptional regulator